MLVDIRAWENSQSDLLLERFKSVRQTGKEVEHLKALGDHMNKKAQPLSREAANRLPQG